jgi:DNA-binding Xre family transcriptional regulator
MGRVGVVNDNTRFFSVVFRGAIVLRFRINELIEQWNAQNPDGAHITMRDVAQAIGVPRSTLAVLTTFNRRPVTNTAHLEALCRFFRLQDWRDLLEFSPPIERTETVVVDELYPERAMRGRRRET